jgi:two-component system CheB/CheR fusion protein
MRWSGCAACSVCSPPQSSAPAISGVGGALGYVWFHQSAATALTIWHHWFTSDAIRIIAVWDSGVGIMGEHLPSIFEEHHQVADSAQLVGFGLGLAIVRRLAKLLGHEIDVRSTPGKGSTFSVEVPVAPQMPDAAARLDPPVDASSAPFHGMLLLIEDDSFVRAAMESLLRSEGIRTISAATGNEASALVTEKGIPPDVVVSDFNLPGSMDGVACVMALRTVLAWKIPAIIPTGDIRSQVIDAIGKHDVSVAIKPLRADEFVRLLSRLHAGSPPRRN